MRFILWFTFILLLAMPARGQEVAIADKDLVAIEQIKNDTLRMDSIYSYAMNVMETDLGKSIDAGKELIRDATEHGYIRGVAGGNFVLGGAYEYVPDYPQSLKYYLEALKLQKELKVYNLQINTLLGISRVYDQTGDLEHDKQYVMEAVAISEQQRSNPRVKAKRGLVLDYLATIYKKEGKYDTAVVTYQEAIAIGRKDGDEYRVMGSLCNMAIALKSAKRYKESLAAYQEALSMTDTSNAEAYTVLNDNMAILFYNMGDYARSEEYSLTALKYAQRTMNTGAKADIYDNLKNTYTAQGKYREALEAYTKWNETRDTIINQEKGRQIKELQAKYDATAKDKQIALQQTKIAFDKKVNGLLILSCGSLILVGVIIYRSQRKTVQRNRIIEEEKKRSESLLLNILPEATANELKLKGKAASHKYELVTVMFIDFVGFTLMAEHMKAEELVEKIDHYFKAFDTIILKHGLEKIKTIGDAYMCAGGLPMVNTSNPMDVLSAAMDIMKFMESEESGHSFKVRIGIHSGPLVAGVVGKHKFQYDIWGDTVNVAARIEENSAPGRINISGQTYELVKGNFSSEYRGKINAKNKGDLDMYFVNSRLN